MLIKILSLSLIGMFMSVILKKHCRELVPLFEIAVVIGSIYLIISSASVAGTGLGKIISLYSGDDGVFSSLFKGAAVTVLSRLASDVCRESGNSLMGDISEIGGRMMLIILAAPFIEKVTETALSFV